MPFVAWLFRIAANALADHWKREGRDSHELPPEIPDEREHQDLERRLGLFQLVDRLPDAQRQVIQMRFVEGRSIREVAAALDRSEGAIKQLQLRAIDTLRKGMEERPAGRSGSRDTMADQSLPDRLDEVIDALVARGDASAALRDPELAPLARVAADLRHYPNREFTARLRAQLERRTTMTTATLSPGQVREGFTTVTPYIWVPDRGLADFLVRTFDAVETSVADNPGHGIHRELRIGSSMVMIGETGPTQVDGCRRARSVPRLRGRCRCDVCESDRGWRESLGVPEDRHYGERAGFVRDAYGNHWYIATALGPQSLGHALRTVTPYLHARDVERLHGVPRARVWSGRGDACRTARRRHPLRAHAIRRRRGRVRDLRSDARLLLPVCRGSGCGVRAGACRRREVAVGASGSAAAFESDSSRTRWGITGTSRGPRSVRLQADHPTWVRLQPDLFPGKHDGPFIQNAAMAIAISAAEYGLPPRK